MELFHREAGQAALGGDVKGAAVAGELPAHGPRHGHPHVVDTAVGVDVADVAVGSGAARAGVRSSLGVAPVDVVDARGVEPDVAEWRGAHVVDGCW